MVTGKNRRISENA